MNLVPVTPGAQWGGGKGGGGKGWGGKGAGSSGYQPYAKGRGLPEDELRKLGEDVKAILGTQGPGGMRMSSFPQALLAQSGLELRELVKKGGYIKPKDLLRAIPEGYFEMRPDPRNPLELVMHLTDEHRKELDPPLPPFQEMPGEDPLLRAARMAEHRAEHEARCRRLRGEDEVAAAAGSGGPTSAEKAKNNWQAKLQLARLKRDRGGSAGLPFADLEKLAKALKESLESDPKHARQGVQMGLVPQLLLVKCKIHLKEYKERGNYFSQRALIEALPKGFFRIETNPLTHTKDIILFPLEQKKDPEEKEKELSLVEAWRPSVGAAVDADWDGSWLPATVTAVNRAAGTVDIRWEDGSLTPGLCDSKVRQRRPGVAKTPSAAAPAAREAVQVQCPHCSSTLQVDLIPGTIYQCANCKGNLKLDGA